MRITFLLTQDLESPSGLGRYWPIGKELARIGHKVEILALHSNYKALEKSKKNFRCEGVCVRYVGQMHVQKIGDRKHYFRTGRLLRIVLKGTIKLTFYALRTQTDAYHIGKPHPMNGLAGIIASRLNRKPLYLDCDDYEAASNRFSGRWQKKILSLFEQTLPRFSRGVTTNTHFTLRKLLNSGIPKGHITYVPNGVDRSRISSSAGAEVTILRNRLNLEDKKVVLYLGSMSLTNHAVDLLLKAFAIVKQAEPQAILLMVGGGEDYEVLRAKSNTLDLGGAILFVGRVSPTEVPLYYHLADVSVDPVRDDPASRARSPLKLVESLAAGTPVVTGNVGDRSEQLAYGGGLLVKPGDADEIAKALVDILKDRALQARLSQEALVSREHFFWDVLVDRFVGVYKSD